MSPDFLPPTSVSCNLLKTTNLLPGSFQVVSGKESTCQCRRHERCRFDPWIAKIPWRKWQPTPVFLPGKFHEQRSLVGYSPWGCKELDTTEHTHLFSGSMDSLILGISYKQNHQKCVCFLLIAKFSRFIHVIAYSIASLFYG